MIKEPTIKLTIAISLLTILGSAIFTFTQLQAQTEAMAKDLECNYSKKIDVLRVENKIDILSVEVGAIKEMLELHYQKK